MKNKGIGREVISTFYDELFSICYASVTSSVFEFNKPSLKLHEQVAEFNGTRIDSYYMNGTMFDMNYFMKVNPQIENN